MAERNLEPRELNTHPNFKIVHPSISSAEDIYDLISPALCNQLNLVRRTTPFESKQLDYEEIEVYWPDIDRVYYIKLIHFLYISIYQMVFRMDYNGTPLYVQLIAKVRPSEKIFRYWKGLIFVSRDANLFMKLVLSLVDCDKAPIYQSLAEDGIYVEEIEDNDEILFSTYARMTRKTLPTLQYLCCETVYLNEILRAHSVMLPIILQNTLDDFIKTNEAIEDYEKMFSYPYKSRFSLDKLLEIIVARKNTLAAQN